MSDVACVIPAYDAAGTLASVASGLRASLPNAMLIVVDDGSSDHTYDVAQVSCDRVVRLDVNHGKGAALRAGFVVALDAHVASVITIDADGQHDPARAPDLLAALADADVVIGARDRTRGVMPMGRRVTNALASAAVGAIVGVPVPDAQSGYRAMRREVLEAIHATGDRYEYETELLIDAVRRGFRIASVEVPTTYGAPSHFRAWDDSLRVVRTIWRHRSRGPV
ncbi:MAG: glycosyltransferase family 2 protein [Gemmatimonadota bacterium]|nr:glycosyltransferase family 2 protein [Gemmatimonadota bacterium]